MICLTYGMNPTLRVSLPLLFTLTFEREWHVHVCVHVNSRVKTMFRFFKFTRYLRSCLQLRLSCNGIINMKVHVK